LREPDLLSIHLALPEPATTEGGDRDGVAALTRRERGVINAVAMGKGSDEIASMLSISPATVRTHVRNAMAKVGAHTRAQLIAIVLGGARAPQPTRAADDDGA
jgi:DNA-binding NarL/FixJ family response regulator